MGVLHGQASYIYNFTCPAERVAAMFAPDSDGFAIRPIALHLHMHNLGKRMWLELIRDGKVVTTIGRDDHYGGYCDGGSVEWGRMGSIRRAMHECTRARMYQVRAQRGLPYKLGSVHRRAAHPQRRRPSRALRVRTYRAATHSLPVGPPVGYPRETCGCGGPKCLSATRSRRQLVRLRGAMLHAHLQRNAILC